MQTQPYHLSVCLSVDLSSSLSVSLHKLGLRFSLSNCLSPCIKARKAKKQTNRKHAAQTMRLLVGSLTVEKHWLARWTENYTDRPEYPNDIQ